MRRCAARCLILTAIAGGASAQPPGDEGVADFYRGKALNLEPCRVAAVLSDSRMKDAGYCGWMLLARITSPQRLISLLSFADVASGVCSSAG